MVAVLVIGLLMNAIVLPLAAKRVLFLYQVISSGQPAPDRIKGVTGRIGAALKRQVVEVFGQKKLLKWSVPGAAHFFVFWAFLILATVYLEAYGSLAKILFTGGEGPMDWAIPIIGHWAVLGFLQDFIAMMAFFGIVTFVVIRVRNAPENLGRRSRFFGSHLSGAWITLFMIFNVIWTMFLFRGASAALGNLPYKDGAFISIGVGKVIDGLSHEVLEVIEGIGLLLHIGVMLVFLVFVLNSKHLHIFLAPLNVLFGRQPVALGAAKPMMSGGQPLTLDDFEDLDEDSKLGVGAAEDFSWKGVLDMATCTECGRCQDQCPAWNTEKPLSPKLLIMALRDHTMAKAPYLLAHEDDRERMVERDKVLAKEVERPLVGDTGDDWFYMPEDGSGVIDPDVLWSCVTCGACVQQCPVDIEHVDHIVDMRRYQVLVESNFPAELNGLFKGLENKGNPWNMSATARMDWAKDLPFEVKVVGEDVESLDEVDWLFWVGCAGAYEDRAKKTTRAVAELLDMAGVSFAVLGNGETCNGDSARRAGNEFVFQGLAAQNVETFKEYKVKKAVTTCAHCFNTLKNEYRELGIELEVVHHTQLLNRLVREKKLTPVSSNGGADKRSITYHDPCYIGRHNGVYSPPRELLNVLPDAQFTEMPRNSERSFCCGAGGARMWMEENIGSRINETRTLEAVGTGADQIAVGCPFCRVMLSDGLTAAQSRGEAREEVEVLDVAQMLLASVKGETGKPAKKAAAASEAKAGAGAGAGGTATATIEREDEATKAEPDTGDTTQTEDTVTDTEDVGAAAKASGGSSLFDLGDDSDGDSGDGAGDDSGEPEAKAAEKTEAEDKAQTEEDADTPEETEPEAKKAETSDEGFGGSLFDVGDDSDSDSEAPEEKPAAEAKPEDTGEDVDRSQDDADTDVQPDQDQESEDTSEPEAEAEAESSDEGFGGSLFDVGDDSTEEPEEKPAAEAKPEDTGEDVDRSQDDADTDVQPDQDQESEDTAEPEAEAESADEGFGGGSLFDVGDDSDEPEEKPAKEPSSQDTGDDVDRSQDDADTDVAPDEDQESEEPSQAAETAEAEDEAEAEAEGEAEGKAEDTAGQPDTEPESEEAPASSGTAITPGTEIPEGGSLFDIEAPAEEEVSRPAPAADQEPADQETAETEDAAADSTTDGDVDRSKDDADTDVEPDTDESPEGDSAEDDHEAVEDSSDESTDTEEAEDETSADDSDKPKLTSLRDIKAKYADGDSGTGTDDEPTEDQSEEQADESDSEDQPSTEESTDEADDSEEPEETDESEDEKPKPAASGAAHQPRTDAEIGEGGSLFDL